MIKKLLLNLNLQINKQYCKVNKKYSFNISNILFVITMNSDNYKITEIYKKKGKNEKRIISEKLISKELIDIINYLQKKQIA